jgi:hypothetical protein
MSAEVRNLPSQGENPRVQADALLSRVRQSLAAVRSIRSQIEAMERRLDEAA